MINCQNLWISTIPLSHWLLFCARTMGHGIANPPWPNAAAVCSFHAHRTLNTSPLLSLRMDRPTICRLIHSIPLSSSLPPVGRFAKRNHREGGSWCCCCPWGGRGWWWRSWIDAEPARKVEKTEEVLMLDQISVTVRGKNWWLFGCEIDNLYDEQTLPLKYIHCQRTKMFLYLVSKI